MKYGEQLRVRLPQELIDRISDLPESKSDTVRRALYLYLETGGMVSLEILNAKLDKIIDMLEEE